MSESSTSIQPLIEKIKQRTMMDRASSGAVAMLNLIPFAGGAVAAIIGDIAAERRFHKVCDVLANLNATLEQHGGDPEKHLSKDQIIEVVHETLQTVATTSDERKIAALKNGLGYSFTAEDPFEHKQLFLHVLRESTALELTLMELLYVASDPFVEKEEEPLINSIPSASMYPTTLGVNSINFLYQGYWNPIGNRDNPNGQTLLAFFLKRIALAESLLEGVLRILDSKGLTSAIPNLHRSDTKIVRWMPSAQYSGMTNYAGTSALMTGGAIRPTPLENSQTKFGESFLRFCRSS